jgi:hypothetical protein
MRKSVFETNFDRLVKLKIIDKDGSLRNNGKSIAGGYMDLVFERLEHLDDFNSNGTKAFSIAHYFVQNGDLCQDPEMVLFYNETLKTVEAYSFQMAIPPVYDLVYPQPGFVAPRLKKELNSFLRNWLNNLIQQGHGKSWMDSSVEEEAW